MRSASNWQYKFEKVQGYRILAETLSENQLKERKKSSIGT